MTRKRHLNATFRALWADTSPAARASDLASARARIAYFAAQPGATALGMWGSYCATAGIIKAAMRHAGEVPQPLPWVPAGWAVVEA